MTPLTVLVWTTKAGKDVVGESSWEKGLQIKGYAWKASLGQGGAENSSGRVGAVMDK